MSGRLTKPGKTDDVNMVVTCTPDRTAVEFFEFEAEALDAAKINLHPTTTIYVGKVTHQGEHQVRGTAKHIAVLLEVDSELRAAFAREFGARSRADIVEALTGIMAGSMEALRAVHRAALDHEKTQPGVPNKRHATSSDLLLPSGQLICMRAGCLSARTRQSDFCLTHSSAVSAGMPRDELSALPCRCGERHRLDQWDPKDQVQYAEQKRQRHNPHIQVGDVGRVVEWSQYGAPLYYRVEFPNGERENFDPCELRSVQ